MISRIFNARPLIKFLLMGGVVGLFVVALSYFNLMADLERRNYDFLLSQETGDPSNDILIVGITEDCLDELGAFPWERSVHAELLNYLTAAEAAVVGMDIIFSEQAQDPEMDEALVDATAAAGPVVYPAVAHLTDEASPGLFTSEVMDYPFPELDAEAPSGVINVIADPDGILRRAPFGFEYGGEVLPSFALQVWSQYRDYSAAEIERYFEQLMDTSSAGGDISTLQVNDYEYKLDAGGQKHINYAAGPGTFPVLPYHEVLEGEFEEVTFRDKIVLVGYYALGLGDYYFTPFQKDTPMFGIEVHANILNTIKKTGPINPLPLGSNLAIIFGVAVLSFVAFQRLRPLLGLAVLLGGVALLFIIAGQIFHNSAVYMETVYPVTALGLSYGAAVIYNTINERQERERVTRLFGRYVAKQVVDEILEVGEENLKLGGTRRDVTLLFVDIRGFTPLSEKLPPEKVVSVLNEYFDIVTNCIFRNHGTVDKFIGDAVMAIFNAPMELNNHPAWALRAARDIISEGEALQQRVYDMAGVNLYFGIGINSGEAVVGNIGAENRLEYTAIGDTVNLASRLESNAEAGQVLVSRYTYDHVGEQMPLQKAGEITVKGKSEPIEIYELVVSEPESEEDSPG